MEFKTDIQIAQETEMRNIQEIAASAGLDSRYIELYGNYKAKVDYNLLNDKKDEKDGKVILVTAISPTPAGEGKTTTTVGLADALRKIDKNVLVGSQRAFARTGVRRKGRSSRRRICSGGADGRHQPALYRRHARDRAQPTICWQR